MLEKASTQQAPTHETGQPGLEVQLHGRTIDIKAGSFLKDLEPTRQEDGIDGLIIAELELPAKVSPGSDIPKRIALVDFGKIPPGGKPIVYDHVSGQALPFMRTGSRFALMGLNYTPENSHVPMVEVPEGTSLTLGRDISLGKHNNLLDLTGEGNAELSRRHVTISVDGLGNVAIADHSTNGTTLSVPREELDLQQHTINFWDPRQLAAYNEALREVGAPPIEPPTDSPRPTEPAPIVDVGEGKPPHIASGNELPVSQERLSKLREQLGKQ